MAFKFRSRLAKGDDRKVFFPTVHIHDGQVHELEQFDHLLYLQSKEFDSACGRYSSFRLADPATRYVRSRSKVKKFCNVKASKGILDGTSLVHRIRMKGKLSNTDVLAKIDKLREAKTSLNAPLESLPLVAGAAGFTWLINRRNELAQSEKHDS